MLRPLEFYYRMLKLQAITDWPSCFIIPLRVSPIPHNTLNLLSGLVHSIVIITLINYPTPRITFHHVRNQKIPSTDIPIWHTYTVERKGEILPKLGHITKNSPATIPSHLINVSPWLSPCEGGLNLNPQAQGVSAFHLGQTVCCWICALMPKSYLHYHYNRSQNTMSTAYIKVS